MVNALIPSCSSGGEFSRPRKAELSSVRGLLSTVSSNPLSSVNETATFI